MISNHIYPVDSGSLLRNPELDWLRGVCGIVHQGDDALPQPSVGRISQVFPQQCKVPAHGGLGEVQPVRRPCDVGTGQEGM